MQGCMNMAAWTIVVRFGLVVRRRAGVGQAAGDGTARWAARASMMVTAAAASVAPRVIRVICQPGMPVAAGWVVVAGTSPKRQSHIRFQAAGPGVPP